MKTIFSLFLALEVFSFANPQGLDVHMGEAQCSYPDPYTLEVQAGEQAILYWKSFDIYSHEKTRFTLPNADSYVLNRIQGIALSAIFGKLESNGHVVLINPKGIFISDDACIDAGGFIASSFDILDKDFCQGKMKFNLGEGGCVHNRGLITVNEGEVRLIGRDVTHEGRIQVLKNQGRIFLTARGGDIIVKEASILGADNICLEGIHIDINGSRLHAEAIQISADGNLVVQGKTEMISRGSAITTLCAEQGFQIFGDVYVRTQADLLLCANDDLVFAAEGGPICIQTKEGSLSISSNEMVLLQGGEKKYDHVRLIAGGSFRLVAGGPLELYSPAGKAKIFAQKDFFIEADTITVEGILQSQTGPLEILTCDLFIEPNACIELVHGDNPFRITVDDCGDLILMEGAEIHSGSSGAMSFAINGGIHLDACSSIKAHGDLDMIAEEDIELSYASLKTEQGNLDLFVKESVGLVSSSIIAEVAHKGFLHMFAGEDIRLDAHSQIVVVGEEGRGLLVADYSTPKAIGSGQVLCEEGANISLIGTGTLRVYTSTPSEEQEFPSHFTPHWGIFYPTVPKNLITPFNLFYKGL